MSSGSAASVLEARPKVRSVPEFVFSHGHDALELAASAGLVLDAWQADIIVGSMGARPDGKWSAFEVGVEVPRQNGKDAILEVRTLAGLYLVGERLITFSAHQFDTSLEAFRRLLELVEEADLQREIKRISRSHGEEGIELKSGQRVRYRTRTKGGGRGFSGDCLIVNEAMILPESAMGSVFPTLAARPNPQVWYTGSAVDQEVHEHGVAFTRVRARGHAGDDRLAWWEYGAPFEHPDVVPLEAATDPEVWAGANPSMGVRIAEEYVRAEQRALAARTFAVERLGVGDRPEISVDAGRKIGRELWRASLDASSRRSGAVALSFDVSEDRAWSSIGIAGVRADGLWHVEVVDRRPGTDWVLGRVVELAARLKPVGVFFQASSPAASLVAEAENLRVRKLEPVTASEMAQACGVFFDAVTQGTVKRGPQPELDAAVDGAGEKTGGSDTWVWSRKASTVDISPLVVVTVALWAARAARRRRAGVVDLAAALAAAEV